VLPHHLAAQYLADISAAAADDDDDDDESCHVVYNLKIQTS